MDELLYIRFISRQAVGEGGCGGNCGKSSRHVSRLQQLIALLHKGRLVIRSIKKESIHGHNLRRLANENHVRGSHVRILPRLIFSFPERDLA